jgi:hypothetical protein
MLRSHHKNLPFKRSALLASLAVLALYLGSMWDYIRAFTVYGDDAEVAVNSCLPWFPVARWGEWFTEGWSHYLTSYPDWGSIAANTLKPVVNVAFFLEGLLAQRVGESAFLISAYVAPAITAFAAAHVFRKFTRAGNAVSILLGVCVATSAVWIGSLFGAVDIVNTFSLMFATIALALLPTGEGMPKPGLQVALFALMLLAIFSHESALPLPFVCVAMLYAFRTDRPRPVDLWPYLGAFGVWLLVRVFIFQGSADIYALDPTAYPPLKIAAFWAMSAFVPLDVRGTYLARGIASTSSVGVQTLIGVAVGMLVALNVTLLCLVAYDLVTKRDRRRLFVFLAFVLATAPRILVSPSWAASRFDGLPMLTGLILVVLIIAERPRVVNALVAIVLGAQLLYLGTGVMQLKRDFIAEARRASAYAEYAAEAIRTAHPDRVVVVNDRWGFYGVSEYVRYVAHVGDGCTIVAINHFDGAGAIWTTGAAGDGTVSIQRVGEDLVIEVTAEGDSSLKFLGAVEVDFSEENQGFHYELVEGTEDAPTGLRVSGHLDGEDTLVIGYDPATGGFLEPQLF